MLPMMQSSTLTNTTYFRLPAEGVAVEMCATKNIPHVSSITNGSSSQLVFVYWDNTSMMLGEVFQARWSGLTILVDYL